MSESTQGEKHHQFGKPLSDEHKRKISESKRAPHNHSFMDETALGLHDTLLLPLNVIELGHTNKTVERDNVPPRAHRISYTCNLHGRGGH